MFLIDSHCHLHDKKIEDIDACVKRAIDKGVKGMICIACHTDDFDAVQKICDTYPFIASSVGIHPNDASSHLKEHSIDMLQEMIKNALSYKNVVGIGESGLDYYYDHASPKDQRLLFEMQLQLCSDHRYPIIIHTRDAKEGALDIIKNFPNVQGVFHCFSEDVEFAKKALDLGYYLSFSGIVTFAKATTVQEAAIYCPLDRFLVETDSPYLAPVPYRGKTNEPAYVYEVAKKIADLKKIPFEDVINHTHSNTKRLFERLITL